MSLLRIGALPAACIALTSAAGGGVTISEFHAAPNEIALEYDTGGVPRLGYGPAWWEPAFHDAGWPAGTAPLGHSTTGLGQDVGAAMDNKSPALYVRKTFALSAAEAAASDSLILRVSYDDGFVAYLNGREAARANMGPARQFSYCHQVTYRASTTDVQPAEFNLGPASGWLVSGPNVLAIQVHNRDLGGTCLIDASLSASGPVNLDVRQDFSFDDSNDATRVHQNTAGTVSNTPGGVPPAGSWLEAASDPQSDPAWQSLTIVTRAGASGGISDSGALHYTLTQSDIANRAAAMFAPVASTGVNGTAGALTEADLARLDLSFRYHASAGAQFGVRIDPQPGTSASALSGFPVLAMTAGAQEDALREFAGSTGATRTRTISTSGGGSNASSGFVQNSPVLENGPLLRGAAFRYTEDNAAGGGAGGSTGAVKFEITDPPDSPADSDWFQFSLPGFSVRSWTAGAVTAADLARVNLTFAFHAPAGQTWRVFLLPDHAVATDTDRADFGTLTGTGGWQVFERSFATAANTGPMLTTINALSTTAFRLVIRGESAASMAAGEPLLIDRAGISSQWRNYAINFGSAAPATRSAFLTALNSASSKSFVPVITKLSSAVSPQQDELTIDDWRLTSRVSGGVQNYVPAAVPGWKYFVGRCEPSGGLTDPALFNDALYDGDWHDWIELHNDGPAAINLQNWSLTDDPGQPAKWRFPIGSTLPAGGYLIVMCDNRTASLTGAQYLHTNFELSSEGEYLALLDPSGALVSEFNDYPKQNAFHTYGTDPAGGGTLGWLRHGTPGRANSGPFLAARVKTPDFNLDGGFYSGAQVVAISCDTPGAQIRYTMNGTDPSPASPLYSSPLTLNTVGPSNGHCLRARAFLNGAVASETRSATYLINQDSRLRSAPALIFTGDPGRSFHAPFGIGAIIGGLRDAGGVWSAAGINDYNNCLGDLNNALTGGQAWERPLFVELRYPDGRSGFGEEAGIRISGSGHARPRYVLSGFHNAPWSYTNYTEKPSFNLFFRNEYGAAGVSHKLFPGAYPVEYFEQFRIRAGKNDTNNPWIKDEFMRRLYINMGQHGSRGITNTLYLNGTFRGVFNLTERLREPFMQQHYNSSLTWDVRQVTEIANGDATAFNSFVTLLDAYGSDPASQTKYAAAIGQLDLTAYLDYALVNIWGGTGDWPHNNYVASRERSATGRWRWFVWDAEGAFGGFSKHLGYNVITQDLLVSPATGGREICRVWDRLSKNAEFRLACADRIHRHFCNSGALTDARLTSLKNELVAEYTPLFSYLFPTGTLSQSWFTGWVHAANLDKRDVLFRSAVFDDPATAGVNDPREFGYQFPLAGVWPATNGQGSWNAPHPPQFSQHGGDVSAGYPLTILHTEPDTDRTVDQPYKPAVDQTPPGGTIYYTTDGSEPRLTGGAVSASAQVWTAPVALTASFVRVKSRIRSSAGEWSPLTEAEFRPGAESPSASNLVIAEIMYHPPDTTAAEAAFSDRDDFEFVRLLNVGAAPVKLSEARFVNGITFNFANGSVPGIEPGQSVMVVASVAAFRARYGSSYDAQLAGEFTGTSLSNSGERLRLETQSAVTILDFTYDDEPPWPASPDGSGASLVLRDPPARPPHGDSASWAASARPGGLLGDSPAAMDYARWRSLCWDSIAAASDPLSGPAADLDGDGATHLLEYALGSDPHAADAPWPVAFRGTVNDEPVTGIAFRVLRGTAGITITPQVSEDLHAWTAAPEYSPPVPGADGTEMRFHYAPASASRTRCCLRVMVSQN